MANLALSKMSAHEYLAYLDDELSKARAEKNKDLITYFEGMIDGFKTGLEYTVGRFECSRCEQMKPAREMVGDDEPVCLDCHTDAIDRANDEHREVAA